MPRIRPVETGLWTLTPPPLFPFGNKRRCVNRFNQAVLARYVRWAMKRLSFTADYILWTYLPTTAGMLDHLGRPEVGGAPALVLYHCVDEHSAFRGYFMSPEVVRGYDDELTRRADLVIATSDNLRRWREVFNPHTYTVVNAVDIDLFSHALDPTCPLPPELAAIPSPRLGVVGVHDYRLDVDALETLSRADPSWHIVLIGPLKPGQVDEARLGRLSAVHLLGGKTREEVFIKSVHNFGSFGVPYS